MTLLQLPRELRDKILSLVVLSTVISPPEYPSNRNEREQLNDVGCYGWFADSSGVWYQKDTQLTGIPSLTINRQLRNETLAIISHLKLPSLRSYKLDVMIFEDNELWPTWLYVPTTSTRIEEVHATFRIHGTSQRRFCGFHGGDGGPPLIIWSFFNLLERFLQVGPVSRQSKPHDKEIKIRHLVLDIKTPDVPTDMIAPDVPQRRLAALRKQSGVKYLKNPKSVLIFIKSFLGWLSVIPSHGRDSRIVTVAFERVGKISLMLDGVVVHEQIAANSILKPDSNVAENASEVTPSLLEPVFEEWNLRNIWAQRDSPAEIK